MKDLIFSAIQKEDLETLIIDCMNICLKLHEPKKLEEKPEITHNGEGYVDKKEAARLLDCSVALIDKLRRNGKLPRYTIDGIVRFKKSDVLELPKLKEQATAADYRTNLHNKKRA